ncbi:hypothetical protein J28TS4_42610 [Paenibacillus lautus]|nr:hypothetical protein J28TS4_42610 [Paenibacillus lautus]
MSVYLKITVDRRARIIYLNIKLSDYIKVSRLKGVSIKCINVSEVNQVNHSTPIYLYIKISMDRVDEFL